MVRLPKDLYLYVNGYLNYKLVIILIIGVILCVYVITVNIFSLLTQYRKALFFNKITSIINESINKSLYEVYRFSELFFSDGYERLSQLASKFYSTFGSITEKLFIFIAYFVRLFVVIVFLIDVFWFFRFDYFYKVLVFLCIPLIINVLFFLLNDFASNLDNAKSFLIIESMGVDEESNLPITNYRKSPGNEDIDLAYHVQQFILCNKVNGYLEEYKVLLDYYSIRLNIIIYSLYLTGWLYILFQNFL